LVKIPLIMVVLQIQFFFLFLALKV